MAVLKQVLVLMLIMLEIFAMFGNAAGNASNTDDWFINTAFPGQGYGIIDTTGGYILKQIFSSGGNVAHLTKMTVAPNTIINGRRWQDGTYARDYFGGSGTIYLSSYNTASKNGEDPAIWDTGPHNVTPKNDLIDCYAHIRRDGLTANDDLWLFLGFSRVANVGDSYFDAEMFAEPILYDVANERFISPGPDEGHNAWKFDAAGNIIEIGDLIVAATLSTNNPPSFELRIWVSKQDFQNVTPATFNWGAEFNGVNNTALFGYAQIDPPPGNAFGCAVGNSGNTLGPPWGTYDSNGNYSQYHEANQFLEMGLNLTDFGIDPAIIP